MHDSNLLTLLAPLPPYLTLDTSHPPFCFLKVPVDDSPPPDEPETAMAGIVNPSTNKTFGKSGFFNMPKGAKSSYEYNGAPQPAGASLASVEKQQERTQSQVGLPSLLTLPSPSLHSPRPLFALSSLSSPSLLPPHAVARHG